MAGPTRWQVVRLAFKEKIFDQLVTPKTPHDIAEHFGFDPRRTEIFLRALCSMGLAKLSDDLFQLRDENADILRSDSDKCLRSTLMSVSYMRHHDIEALMRNQEENRNMDLHSEDFWDKSGDSLRSFHRGMAVEEMYGYLSSIPEWSLVRTMVDMGAGSEVLADKVVTENLEKTVILMDLPPMVKRMEAALKDHPHAGRITTIAGDYNQVEFPQNVDLMWASLTLYFVKDMTDFFSRARAALKPGGVFVSLHEGLSENRTQPECQIIGLMSVAMEMEDTGMDDGRIAAAMREAGFASITIQPVETVVGPLVLTIGRA